MITQFFVTRDSKGVHIEYTSVTGLRTKTYAKSYSVDRPSNLFIVKTINEEVQGLDIPVNSLTSLIKGGLPLIKLCIKNIINSRSLQLV